MTDLAKQWTGSAALISAPPLSRPAAAHTQPVLTRPSLGKVNIARHRTPRVVRRAATIAVAVGIWQLVCTIQLLSSVQVASPVAVFDAGRELWKQGSLQTNILVSLVRVGEGLALGVTVGLFLAVLSGISRLAEDVIDPVLQAVRAVPILGLVPLAIIWFGVGETPKVFLITLGCAFPVYLNTHAAIRNVDGKLVEAGRTFGLTGWGLVRRVILPGSLPGFLVGLRFAIVGSWLIIIVAEEINAQSGIGFLIMQAQTTDRTDIMFLGLALYALLGLLADFVVRLLESRLLAWRRGFTGS